MELYASGDQWSGEESGSVSWRGSSVPPDLAQETAQDPMASEVEGTVDESEQSNPTSDLSPGDYALIVEELHRAFELQPTVSKEDISASTCSWQRIDDQEPRASAIPPCLVLPGEVWDRSPGWRHVG